MADLDLTSFQAAFFDEAKERLASINQGLVAMEKRTLDDESLIRLRRHAHAIKGSAQMLGVHDVSAMAHLFEEGVEFAISAEGEQAARGCQFLFDLHDALAERMQQVDARPQLKLAPWRARFDALSGMEKSAVAKKRPARRKKPGVQASLIAAVMGTIESSLQQPAAAAAGSEAPGESTAETVQEERMAAEVVDEAATDASAVADAIKDQTIEDQGTIDEAEAFDEAPLPVEEEIDFRPDIEALPETGPEKGSGSFLRVDRSRLGRLSNQIIELGSDRYRGTGLSAELERLMQGFRQVQESMNALDASDAAQLRIRREFDQQLRRMKSFGDLFGQHQKQSAKMIDGLREQVFGLMLSPISDIFSIFPRTVRDVALRAEKQVQLLMAGEAVEVDQLAAQALVQPLTHLINNAVAHGIEPAEVRRAAGKPEEGQITISARQVGGDIRIDVMDDGKGIDVELVRSEAIAMGLISEAEAEEMHHSEIIELIFHPGFSTAPQVTDLSGRGMGMNIVINSMRELTGTVHVQTRKGEGTRFTLSIPVTLAEQRALVCAVGGNRFGLLVNLIHKVDRLDPAQVKIGQGIYSRGYVHFAGQRVPLVDMRLLHGIDEHAEGERAIVIVEHLEGFLGIIVDEVLAERDIILREVDPYLKHYEPVGLMGNAIDEDGSVLLLLEPNGIKQMWRTAPLLQAKPEAGGFDQRMLIVDDSNIALRVERELFSRMGFVVDTAVGGADALEKLSRRDYDLVVTDLEMPGINGIELLQRLRKSKRLAGLPVLVLAARDSESDLDMVAAAGASGFLPKRQLGAAELSGVEQAFKELLDVDVAP